MRLLLTAFDPRRIAGQIASLIVLSVLLVHVVLTAIFLLHSPPPRDGEPGGRPQQERLIASLEALQGAPDAAARAATLASLDRAFPSLRLKLEPDRQLPPGSESRQAGLDHIRHALDRSGIRVAVDRPATGRPDGPAPILAVLRDGTQVGARLDLRDNVPPPVSFAITASLLSIGISFVLLSLWAARTLTSPLTRFAAVAESFSVDGETAALPEAGPIEVKTLSRALNRMRERIGRLVEDRTRMLAAVSHDLRTPITRLRLRAEFITDDAVRGPMLRDLDQMNAMISGALAHLRDGQSGESQAKVELSSLLATVADEFCDIGHDVTYEGPPRLVVLGRSDELARAVTNLVENAIKYGGSAEIRLHGFPSVAEIDVIDRGPGIPASLREAMTQPFTRGDASRNLNAPAGFGLGLSIVRNVAASHGGSLALLDNEGGGLVARLTLPRPPGAEEPRPLAA